VTYPDPDFSAALDALVAPIRINIADRHADFRDATVMTRIPFSPRFRLFSCDRKRLLREWTGWMPTAELIAEFHIARGIDRLERRIRQQRRISSILRWRPPRVDRPPPRSSIAGEWPPSSQGNLTGSR